MAAELEWLSGPLALALKSEINHEIAANALRTFHGATVGERILSGMINRGSGERIRTVIWCSDLRNSTRLAVTLDLDRFLAILNAYFECTAGAVLDHGGQVLRRNPARNQADARLGLSTSARSSRAMPPATSLVRWTSACPPRVSATASSRPSSTALQ
jgi:hypothetical protein